MAASRDEWLIGPTWYTYHFVLFLLCDTVAKADCHATLQTRSQVQKSCLKSCLFIVSFFDDPWHRKRKTRRWKKDRKNWSEIWLLFVLSFFHRLFLGRFWREYMDSVTSANITDACRWSHSLFFMSLAPPFSHAAVISGKVSSQRLESGQSLPLFFYDQSDDRQKKTRWKDTILDTIFGPGNGSQIVSITA